MLQAASSTIYFLHNEAIYTMQQAETKLGPTVFRKRNGFFTLLAIPPPQRDEIKG